MKREPKTKIFIATLTTTRLTGLPKKFIWCVIPFIVLAAIALFLNISALPLEGDMRKGLVWTHATILLCGITLGMLIAQLRLPKSSFEEKEED